MCMSMYYGESCLLDKTFFPQHNSALANLENVIPLPLLLSLSEILNLPRSFPVGLNIIISKFNPVAYRKAQIKRDFQL